MPDTCETLGRPGGLVTLNVGGKLYSTTLETLTRFPDSMLGAMFRGPQPALTDNCGNYFIDRDGKTFRHILNFLRFGHLDLPEGYSELSLLRAEADFYQIRPLLEALRQVETERWRQRTNAILHADVDLRKRLLHFNVRRGPQNYELNTCSLQIFTANVFCTDRYFLAMLRRRLGHWEGISVGMEETHSGPLGDSDATVARESRNGHDANQELQGWKRRVATSRTSCESRNSPGDSTDEDAETDDEIMLDYSSENAQVGTTRCHHLFLEWAPCPPELPAPEYVKQKLHPLIVGGREIRTANEFLEEVLKVALAQGFRVDSVFPDPADILNARSLRFVRH
ncbi:BTB/POZ domain-containing protein KCTD11 [Sceloporus undulatus]|uniref:BTB/POZ domain-containing protein KCTD11 n=1 Tax=Sceloporus undulatus TaxID=8520 RepID=UPI001C4B2F2E|nr:BTB/POZ domain-containing protein KCTD11 [Sceloporus undulatus]XP_042326971.1 BTB/POZ domain-containing protein KCTD11 [Sceloporus undulatus]XP_042326972.1 BTB/POZ domain-containing protein KCTD11 [Sceloporus undulatus]